VFGTTSGDGYPAICLCVTASCSEDAGEEHEDHEGHDEVEYLGPSNGTKAVEPDETCDADKDKDDATDKPPAADADMAAKEPEPDFTVTPSKESQSAALIYIFEVIWSCNNKSFSTLPLLIAELVRSL